MAIIDQIKTPDGTTYDVGNVKQYVGDAYSNTATYNVGDYCIYDNKLYRCTTKISTAESFTPAHWTETKCADEFSAIKSNLDELSDYSTTEQAVGKWIDGSIVYRKTFSFTTGASTDQTFNIGATIKTLIRIDGGLNYTSGAWYPPQTYFSSTDLFIVWVVTNYTQIKVRSGTINYKPGYVTIYYTK
jgi:hypothetical protein